VRGGGAERLDCGAHGAIAHELFTARGVESFPLQLVQQYSEDATRHWGHKWGEEEVPVGLDRPRPHLPRGLRRRGRRRRGQALGRQRGWWINPRQTSGYGSLLALRVCDASGTGRTVAWAGRSLRTNVWTDL
jgi:hypothetical protein